MICPACKMEESVHERYGMCPVYVLSPSVTATLTLVVCEHHEDFHTKEGCYGLGGVNVMGVTDWGPEPFEEAICACEEHLRGRPPYVILGWREQHKVYQKTQKGKPE